MAYVKSDPVLVKALGSDWTMPRDTAWYWECEFAAAQASGTEKLWYEEMPATDQQAFQGSYDNVFGRESIDLYWSQRDTKYSVYGIKGQSIEQCHEPEDEDIDGRFDPIEVSYKSRREETYKWSLVPLKWQETFSGADGLRNFENHHGKLFVWLPPERGYDYAIGVKTGNGIGDVATCISVWRRGCGPQSPDVQAAEFRSKAVSHVEAFVFAMAIAAFYARYMEETTRYREPFVAIEQMMSVGDTTQVQMGKMGYHRFHKMVRYDSDPKLMRKSKSRKRGWYSSSWSTPMLTDDFVIWVRNEWCVINSPFTLYECDHWEVHYTGDQEKSKFIHQEDCTDDGIFAAAMACFCPNDLRPMAERTIKQSVAAGAAMPLLDMRPISEGVMMEMRE